jgi:hypothetical protein
LYPHLDSNFENFYKKERIFMLYVTGDLHGDESRLRPFRRGLVRHRHLLLVCGDFGFVWNGSEEEARTLRRLERLDCTILFIEGTHDNLDLLGQYPEEEAYGGRVRRVAANLLWLQRGEIYDIDGTRVFALGGAQSPDTDDRTEGVNWWRSELPDSAELAHAADTLAHAGHVDVVITHQNPCAALGADSRSGALNPQTVFLADMMRSADYGHWYYGGDHVDRTISPRMTAVFEKVIPLQERK